MDVEILKELKSEVSNMAFIAFSKLTDKNARANIVKTGNDLQKLIDEAIALQTTSKEVQEAIEWVTNTRHRNQHMSGDWTAPMGNHINQTIQDTIITALQEYQPWIPVSERLPKNSEHDWVLAQITEDNGYMWIPKVVEYREGIGDWYCEELGWLKTHNATFKVTHWKPLPEPPKGE